MYHQRIIRDQGIIEVGYIPLFACATIPEIIMNRRSFLKTSATAPLAAAASSVLPLGSALAQGRFSPRRGEPVDCRFHGLPAPIRFTRPQIQITDARRNLWTLDFGLWTLDSSRGALGQQLPDFPDARRLAQQPVHLRRHIAVVLHHRAPARKHDDGRAG